MVDTEETYSSKLALFQPPAVKTTVEQVQYIEFLPSSTISKGLVIEFRIPGTSADLFIYLGFYVAFNTVQVISRRVVGRAEETSTYSSLGFCTVNCRPTASNYQLSHLRP